MKIYAATVEVLKKEERRVKFSSPLNANVFCFFESHPIYDQTQGSWVDFFTL